MRTCAYAKQHVGISRMNRGGIFVNESRDSICGNFRRSGVGRVWSGLAGGEALVSEKARAAVLNLLQSV